MLYIKNTKVYGLEESIKRSGLPHSLNEPKSLTSLTENDFKRTSKLANVPNGSGHDNFLKGIIVQFDILYPQYFTPQLQRYSFVDIVSSQSKMHSITKAGNIEKFCNKYVDMTVIDCVNRYIENYNSAVESMKYEYFMRIISNLPMGFQLWMSISTNYLQLKTIYSQRKNHKLVEDWGEFCHWIKELPHSYDLIRRKL